MTTYNVLGTGFVRIEEVMGSDLTVVNAARVSFDKRKGCLGSDDVRLIDYLASHDHFTPFAQPQIRFHIRMPIFVARQWYKHTVGFTRNEVSRRYVKSKPTFYEPESLRLAAENVKQGSSSEIHHDSESLVNLMQECANRCEEVYQRLLDEGVCAEQARMVLPQSMFTEFIETGSLAAYARLFSLRTDMHAQHEIQQYARVIGKCIQPAFPHSWKALTGNE